MNKNIKEKLEKEKAQIEKSLGNFAEKDKNIEGDWDARFPKWNGDGSSSSNMEISADEVEEYSKLLSLEHVLEIRLKNINSALKKLKEGKYGFCEKCGKKIPDQRLQVCPEARFCLKCK
jgi:RNA polymerase-binding transcription factor DksA